MEMASADTRAWQYGVSSWEQCANSTTPVEFDISGFDHRLLTERVTNPFHV